jgi:hypothetical protein
MVWSRRLRFLALVGIAAVPLLSVVPARADNPLPQAITHQHFNFIDPLVQSGDGSIPQSSARHPANPICSTATSTAANVNTDCEGDAPHNETSIAVNPTNSLNLVGSANDYQLTLSPGGTLYETIYSRAHTTFDGGRTWTTYPIDFGSYVATGDPAVAFDAAGNVYLATLGFLFSQGLGCCTNPDVLVAHSSDGGKTWSTPTRVASGSGSFGSVGTFNDKEYLTAWGNGNAIVTWTVFNDGQKGSYISSPIFDVVTHDGGNTWTSGTSISGSASFCVGAQGGTTCDQDQGSVPVMTADGSISVAFLNTFDVASGRDQYLVVKVDPQTGQRTGGPFRVARLVDGVSDYPVNEDGRQTYQDSEFRSWSAGNIAADPTLAGHLAVAWSDMRNSQLPAPADPYQAKTNSDVVVSQSFDGGQTWSSPAVLARRGDQFMPWAAYDTSGKLRIGFFDRSYDSANHRYGYTLASEAQPGTLGFTFSQLTTRLSNPTQGDRWFSGRTPNASFPHPSSFIGDYSGIAASPSGVAALWTDMRNTSCFPARCGFGEDAYYATGS